MNAILKDIENECIDLIGFIDSRVNAIFTGETKTYTYWLKHPELEKYAVVVDLKDIEMLNNKYPQILAGFGQILIDSVEEIDSTWIVIPDDLDI